MKPLLEVKKLQAVTPSPVPEQASQHPFVGAIAPTNIKGALPIPTDVHPAITYLKALGYKTGDRIYGMCIAPKKMPMEVRLERNLAWVPPGKDKPVPINIKWCLEFDEDSPVGGVLYREYDYDNKPPKRFKDGLNQLHRWNSQEYGIYVRPNAGGHEDKDVIRCPVLFYEIDGIPKPEQWERLKRLEAGGFYPKIVIPTRNSLHVYYRTKEEGVAGWRKDQQRIIQNQDSDEAIYNESRLMRLPGFLHWQWDEVEQWNEPFPVEIAVLTDNVYSRADFDAFLPPWDESRWGEKERKVREYKAKAERGEITINPIADAFDIRNFAHLFDGAHTMKDGWIAARCPHHNGSGVTSFRVDEATGAFKCWNGCNSKDIYRSGVELAKSCGYVFPEKTYNQEKEDWQAAYEEKRREVAKTKFTREPDLRVTEGHFPNCELKHFPRKFLAVKGGQGTGKSTLTGELAGQWAHTKIQVGHLNALMENTAPKFGLIHHKELKEKNLPLSGCPEIAITDVSMALMLDISLYRDEPFMLILDEVRQLLENITSGKNLKRKLRLEARFKLEWLVKNATWLIICDADIDDDILEYLEDVRGEKAYVIHHTGKIGEGRLPIKITSNKGDILKNLYADIDAGKKVIFPVETKADLEVIEEKVQSKTTQIVHGNNSSVPEIKDFIRDIDKLYTQYKNLGYTSTIGTGVDLSTPHFEKKYAIFSGSVLTANEQLQLLARSRPDVETVICIEDKKKTLEIDTDQILAKLVDKNTESGKMVATNVNYLIQEGLYPAPNGEIRDEDRAYLKLWATFKASRNASLANPKQTLCDRLQEAGYILEIVEDFETEETEKIEKSHKEAKKENRELEDEAIASVPLLSDEEYTKLKMQKGNLSVEKRRQITKTKLHKNLGIEITKSVVEMERKHHISSSVKLLHILLSDDKGATAYEMQDRDWNPVMTDRSFYLLKYNLLRELRIPELIQQLQVPGFRYTQDTEIIKTIANLARNKSADVKALLGVAIRFEKVKAKGDTEEEGKKNSGKKKNEKQVGEFKQSTTEIVNSILTKKLGVMLNSERATKDKIHTYWLDFPHWQKIIAPTLEHLEKNKPSIDEYLGVDLFDITPVWLALLEKHKNEGLTGVSDPLPGVENENTPRGKDLYINTDTPGSLPHYEAIQGELQFSIPSTIAPAVTPTAPTPTAETPEVAPDVTGSVTTVVIDEPQPSAIAPAATVVEVKRALVSVTATADVADEPAVTDITATTETPTEVAEVVEAQAAIAPTDTPTEVAPNCVVAESEPDVQGEAVQLAQHEKVAELQQLIIAKWHAAELPQIVREADIKILVTAIYAWGAERGDWLMQHRVVDESIEIGAKVLTRKGLGIVTAQSGAKWFVQDLGGFALHRLPTEDIRVIQ